MGYCGREEFLPRRGILSAPDVAGEAVRVT
jgi:hypothetical protein